MITVAWVSRNDDHGGRLLARAQAALDGLIKYRREGVDLELVFVEWNPPPEAASLRLALSVPRDFPVRWYVVPPEVHRGFPNWEQFALWPHVGANVAMRRARGKWVLTTTHDCVWSAGLAAALAGEGALRIDAFYRACRFDAHADLSRLLTVEERIAHMEAHMIKRNTWKTGMFTKSCGDFIMMTRDCWHALRGYVEWPVNGIWLDGLLMHAAAAWGLEQVVFPDPIYHMEHEGRGLHIYKGLPHLPRKAYLRLIARMAEAHRAVEVNAADWGLAALAERQVADNAWVLEGEYRHPEMKWYG